MDCMIQKSAIHFFGCYCNLSTKNIHYYGKKFQCSFIIQHSLNRVGTKIIKSICYGTLHEKPAPYSKLSLTECNPNWVHGCGYSTTSYPFRIDRSFCLYRQSNHIYHGQFPVHGKGYKSSPCFVTNTIITNLFLNYATQFC